MDDFNLGVNRGGLSIIRPSSKRGDDHAVKMIGLQHQCKSANENRPKSTEIHEKRIRRRLGKRSVRRATSSPGRQCRGLSRVGGGTSCGSVSCGFETSSTESCRTGVRAEVQTLVRPAKAVRRPVFSRLDQDGPSAWKLRLKGDRRRRKRLTPPVQSRARSG
jgi:hypothetical protein